MGVGLACASALRVKRIDADNTMHTIDKRDMLNAIREDINRFKEEKQVELFYEGGIAAFVRYLDRTKAALFPDPIAIHGQRDDIGIDVALEWNDSYYENVLPFTNNIPQRDGGTHMAAFRAALSDHARRVLHEGDRRIFERPRASLGDGWVVVVFSVPESERRQRHTLRSRLTWLGYGTVSAGVWW